EKERERREGMERVKAEEAERRKKGVEKRSGPGEALGTVVTGVGTEGELRGVSEDARRGLEREGRATGAGEGIGRMGGGARGGGGGGGGGGWWGWVLVLFGLGLGGGWGRFGVGLGWGGW